MGDRPVSRFLPTQDNTKLHQFETTDPGFLRSKPLISTEKVLRGKNKMSVIFHTHPTGFLLAAQTVLSSPSHRTVYIRFPKTDVCLYSLQYRLHSAVPYV